VCLLAVLNSFVCDYCARQKVGNITFNFFIMKQVPALSATVFNETVDWLGQSLLSWFLPRVIELIYTASDMRELASDCDYDKAPFVWKDDRRFEIRSELDAALFHLYLPSEATGEWLRVTEETHDQVRALMKHFAKPRDAVVHIMEQFRLVRQKDENRYDEYRTKNRILEIFDEMLISHSHGRSYQTTLDPQPGVV
jgi:hypothetical protein